MVLHIVSGKPREREKESSIAPQSESGVVVYFEGYKYIPLLLYQIEYVDVAHGVCSAVVLQYSSGTTSSDGICQSIASKAARRRNLQTSFASPLLSLQSLPPVYSSALHRRTNQ